MCRRLAMAFVIPSAPVSEHAPKPNDEVPSPTETRQYCHVIWDWNGTLLDDVNYSVDLMNALLDRHGLPIHPHDVKVYHRPRDGRMSVLNHAGQGKFGAISPLGRCAICDRLWRVRTRVPSTVRDRGRTRIRGMGVGFVDLTYPPDEFWNTSGTIRTVDPNTPEVPDGESTDDDVSKTVRYREFGNGDCVGLPKVKPGTDPPRPTARSRRERRSTLATTRCCRSCMRPPG